MAPIFESSAEFIGAMVLGVALYKASGGDSVLIPWPGSSCLLGAVGVLSSLVGILSVRPALNVTNPMAERAIRRSPVHCRALCRLLCSVALRRMAVCGLWRHRHRHVDSLSLHHQYTRRRVPAGEGDRRTVAQGRGDQHDLGLSVGMETTGLPALVIAAALLSSYSIGKSVDFPAETAVSAGIFGTAVATMGMLMAAAYILAMDTFGPIADNAGGIVEMTDQPESVRVVTDALDSAGNTTKALTKDTPSAPLPSRHSCFSPLSGGSQPIQRRWQRSRAGRQCGRTEGLRRRPDRSDDCLPVHLAGDSGRWQRRRRYDRGSAPAVPGRSRIMPAASKPDYAKCVDISVRSALREMVLPGVLAVSGPIVVGVALGWEAAAGLLMIGTIAGVLMALFLNNGGAWDNAKKYIEAGLLKDEQGKVIGKGTEAHAAAVVGDTVGDPFKDTAGPSLHVLIKLFATVTLVLAPLFI